MFFFKTKFFILIVLVAIAATFYYFGDPQKLYDTVSTSLKNTPLAPAVEKIENTDVTELTQQFQSTVENAESEVTTLTERTTEVGKHTGNVLGSSIQPASEEQQTPIHEKAFEYGKYIYCKQVVEDYETMNPSLKEE